MQLRCDGDSHADECHPREEVEKLIISFPGRTQQLGEDFTEEDRLGTEGTAKRAQRERMQLLPSLIILLQSRDDFILPVRSLCVVRLDGDLVPPDGVDQVLLDRSDLAMQGETGDAKDDDEDRIGQEPSAADE